jgi:hypothetical protein
MVIFSQREFLGIGQTVSAASVDPIR